MSQKRSRMLIIFAAADNTSSSNSAASCSSCCLSHLAWPGNDAALNPRPTCPAAHSSEIVLLQLLQRLCTASSTGEVGVVAAEQPAESCIRVRAFMWQGVCSAVVPSLRVLTRGVGSTATCLRMLEETEIRCRVVGEDLNKGKEDQAALNMCL